MTAKCLTLDFKTIHLIILIRTGFQTSPLRRSEQRGPRAGIPVVDQPQGRFRPLRLPHRPGEEPRGGQQCRGRDLFGRRVLDQRFQHLHRPLDAPCFQQQRDLQAALRRNDFEFAEVVQPQVRLVGRFRLAAAQQGQQRELQSLGGGGDSLPPLEGNGRSDDPSDGFLDGGFASPLIENTPARSCARTG